MLINEIKRYIRNKSLSQLSRETKIGRKTLYTALRGELLQKKTIDLLYRFFNLPIDEFYIKNLEKRKKKADSNLGQIVKIIRISIFGENWKEFSKRMGVSERTLARIEAREHKDDIDLLFLEKLFQQLVIDNTQNKDDNYNK